MSYVVEIRIACDEPTCSKVYGIALENRGGLSKTRAGNMAAERGWQITSGRTSRADPKLAYCPGHRR